MRIKLHSNIYLKNILIKKQKKFKGINKLNDVLTLKLVILKNVPNLLYKMWENSRQVLHLTEKKIFFFEGILRYRIDVNNSGKNV